MFTGVGINGEAEGGGDGQGNDWWNGEYGLDWGSDLYCQDCPYVDGISKLDLFFEHWDGRSFEPFGKDHDSLKYEFDDEYILYMCDVVL